MTEPVSTIGAQCVMDAEALLELVARAGAPALAITMIPDVANRVSVRAAPVFFPLSGEDAVALLDDLPAGSTIAWRKVAA